MPAPLSLLLVLLAGCLCLAAAGEAAPSRSHPNIVIILTDDQGWPDLGVHGNPDIETPSIDRLASEGVRFSRFYASPVCTPTRASLMTGRYHQRTGAIDTYQGRDTLAAEEVTLAETLRGAGYRTGIFGKWHLGRYMRYHPQSRGFDDFFGFWQYGFINRYFDSPELWEGRTPVITEGYCTDVLTDEAIRFVERAGEKPFFLYLPYNAPHAPYQAPDPLVQKYVRKGLALKDAQVYGMIDSIDQNVGRLLTALDRQGLRENTLVLFMTDNGGVNRHFTAGLRGLKGTVFEGGIRVPLIARWPGQIPQGKTVDAPAQHIDLFPTLCEAAGASLPTGRKLDGRSVLPLMRSGGGESPHRYLYHQWTRVRPNPDENWAIHEGRWKLANCMLFDLESDPGESRDLAKEHPERAVALREEFLRWFREVTDGQSYARVPIQVGRPDENPVEIDLTWGEPRGKVRPLYRHYNRDYTADWSVPGDAIEWKIEVAEPGPYEVELIYGCAPEDAGGVYRLTAAGATLEGRTEPGGRSSVYIPRRAGALTLPRGETTLRIEAVSIPDKVLMELHKMRLRRVAE